MSKSNDKKEVNEEGNEFEYIQTEIKLNEKIESLELDIDKMKLEVENYKQIAASSQNQYVLLKNDFDSYKRRVEENEKKQKIEQLINITQKIIPIVEDLRKTLDSMPKDLESNSWAQWVSVLYKSLLKKLNSMWIEQIDSLWDKLNENYHEPIASQVDKKNIGKIINEFEKWYIYRKWDEEIIVQAAKVVVWTK